MWHTAGQLFLALVLTLPAESLAKDGPSVAANFHQWLWKDVDLRNLGWKNQVGRVSGDISEVELFGRGVNLAHCARRPPWLTVTMILSANKTDVTSVGTPSTKPTTCLVVAGYAAGMEFAV